MPLSLFCRLGDALHQQAGAAGDLGVVQIEVVASPKSHISTVLITG